jgi:hypothetical protein
MSNLSTTPAATRSMARLGAVGGALFAVGNLLHPLEHGDAAESSATWEAAHLLFAAGAVLVCAGLPAITSVMGAGRLARVGAALTWLAMLLIPVGAYFEVYVAPELTEAAAEHIESQSAAFGIVQTLLFVAGPVLLGIAAFRTRTWPTVVCVGLVLGPVLLLLLPGLPGVEGVWIIAGTSILGAALAGAGLVSAAQLAGGGSASDAGRTAVGVS